MNNGSSLSPDWLKKQYEREDLDPNQVLDWTDENQKYCEKHKRNYHIECKECKNTDHSKCSGGK